MTRATKPQARALPKRLRTTSEARFRFDTLVAAFAKTRDVSVRPGWGAGNLVLSIGRKMFALFTTVGFVAKLPRARVDELVSTGAGVRLDPRKDGRLMKEWLVADARADWPSLAREAHKFVRGDGT